MISMYFVVVDLTDMSSSLILSNSFTCNLLLWRSFHICWEAEMVNKESGIFQGRCALTASNVSILRAVMYAVFPSTDRYAKVSFSAQLYFCNEIQDPKKNHKMMKSDDCDQISVPCYIIISVCQKHYHPILELNWWRTLHCEWGINS